jgi:mannan endo-1,4-beta-mannosidase
MKFYTLSAISTACAFSSLATASTYPKVSKVAGLKFEIGNSTKYISGTNAYWLPFVPNNDDIDVALDHIAAAGLKIVRTWGFNDVNEIPANGEYSLERQRSFITN